MSKKQKQPKFCSELRFDLVSKNWVVIASGRALRPKMFKKEKKEIELKSSVENCVFCNIYTQEKPVLIFCHGKSISPEQIPKNWTIIVILEIHSLSPSFSYITLPTPVNFAILVAAVGLIGYVDSFIIIDTYFKSKKEIISYGRWIIVGVALLISAYLAYQMYNFTTFTLSGVE